MKKKNIVVLLLAMFMALSLSACSGKECKADNCDDLNLKALGYGVSKYCDEHACEEDGCKLQREKSGVFCEEHKNNHTCMYDYGCTKTAVKGNDCCKEHTCTVKGCVEQLAGDKYCEEHKCRDCEALALEDCYACEEHKCAVEGCGDTKDDGEYCASHTCDLCDQKTEGYSDMCSAHQGYEYCNSCKEYKPDVELRTIAGGDTEDYTGEDYDWCSDCFNDYKSNVYWLYE